MIPEEEGEEELVEQLSEDPPIANIKYTNLNNYVNINKPIGMYQNFRYYFNEMILSLFS